MELNNRRKRIYIRSLLMTFPILLVQVTNSACIGQQVFNGIKFNNIDDIIWRDTAIELKKPFEVKIYSSNNAGISKGVLTSLEQYSYNGFREFLTIGDDIENDKIDYKASYKQINLHYVESTVAFNPGSNFIPDQIYGVNYGQIVDKTYSPFVKSKDSPILVKSHIYLNNQAEQSDPDSIQRFDSEGKLKQVYYYGATSSSTRKIIKGPVIDSIITIYFNGEYKTTLLELKTKSGKILENITFDEHSLAKGGVLKKIFAYTGDKLSKVLFLDDSGQLISSETYIYKNNKLQRFITETNTGNGQLISEFTYNDFNQIVHKRDIDTGSNIVSEWFYKYNKYRLLSNIQKTVNSIFEFRINYAYKYFD